MNLSLFTHSEFGKVRASVEGGKPLFVAKDVAVALGYARPADAVTDHCKGVAVLPTPSAGGTQMMKWIPESDLFRLIMRSKLAAAEKFQDWVCEDVLPSIRATGSYTIPSAPATDFDFKSDIARRLGGINTTTEDGVRAYTLLHELYLRVSAPALLAGGEPVPHDGRRELLADLTRLVTEIVTDRECDAVILPAVHVLELIQRLKLLRWIFPEPRDRLWHNDRAEQSRFGKFMKRELVGRDFSTPLGIVRVMRGASSRCSTIVFLKLGKEAAA